MSNAAIVRPFLAKNGVDNNGNKITNLSSPIAATDGANKIYVDSSISTATSLLVNNSSLGVNNGVATLDTTGKVPVSQVSNSINVPLTAYGSTTGTITATDTILTAIEKLNGNLAAATAGNSTLTLVNGAETSISLTTSTLTSNQIVDTFLISNVRSVKYLIQVSSLGNSYYQMSELLAIHDGTNPYISEINTILTNSAVATFSADINGANFELLVTPLYTNLSIKIIRTTINS